LKDLDLSATQVPRDMGLLN